MKHIFLLAILLLGLNSLQAQITKRNWLVGGDANLSTSKSKFSNGNESDRATQFLISPNAGYFFADKFAGGLKGSIGFTKLEGESINTGFNIGPFIRYYFLDIENRTNLFSEVSYAYGDSGTGLSSNSYSIKAGPAIFLNSSVAIEITLAYNYAKNSSQTSNNQIIAGVGLQIHLEK